MSLEYVFDSTGAPANLDDMSPSSRAFAFLLEHANRRRRDAKLPLPCPCDECARLAACFRAEPTGNPDEILLVFSPVSP